MIKIVIPGRPQPKQRPRLGVRGRKAFIYTPPETVAYEQLVGYCAKMAVKEPLLGPLELHVTVYLCGKRMPDLSNCIKSIEDGMNNIAYADDSQVKRIVAEMREVAKKDEERAEVEIVEIAPEEASA